MVGQDFNLDRGKSCGVSTKDLFALKKWRQRKSAVISQ